MAKLNLKEPHARQWEIINDTSRFRVAVCGRRFGKTYIGVRTILLRAINHHETCWWLAPTYDMAAHAWRALKEAIRDIPRVRISESDLRMDFPGGGSLEIHSTYTPDHLRGAGLDFVVLDEAAFMTPDIWPQIVRPMLADRQGSALFLSSPNGKNWFHDLYLRGLSSTHQSDDHSSTSPYIEDEEEARSTLRRGEPVCSPAFSPAIGDNPVAHQPAFSPPLYEVGRGLGGGDNEWHSFHFPTSANPLISPDELASIRAETAERIWLEEYEAEFTDSTGQVFRGIREAASAPLNAQPDPNVRYAVGLDWGRENDYTAIVVMDSATKRVVAVDRFNQVNWSLQRGRLKAICDRWRPVVIWAESNSIGAPNIEALQTEGLPVRPFNTNAATKSPLIEALSLAIERRDIALIPDETLLGELAAYRMERLPAGGYRYSAPPGLHDDMVIALALAWYAANHSSLPISFA